MFFEMAGFLFGMVTIGVALLLLYRREAGRVPGSIHAGSAARQRT